MVSPCVHYVGFRDDAFVRARRLFGGPYFIHRRWDKRAIREIAEDTTEASLPEWAQDRLATLRARVRELEEAIEPFVRFGYPGVFNGTVWATRHTEPVLHDHKTGLEVFPRDFEKANLTLRGPLGIPS